MNPRELVVAAVRFHDLTARQVVKDAAREEFSWSDAPAPDFPYERLRAVYARRMSEAETPAPLKSRNVRALADYLDVL